MGCSAATPSIEENKHLNFEELRRIYKKATGDDQNFEKSSELFLILNDKKDMKAISMFSKYKLPNLEKIIIVNLDEADPMLNNFLVNSFPFKVAKFEVGDSDSKICLDVGPYLDSLAEATSKTTDELKISYFSINSYQLSSLIVASKHCKEITFSRCILDTDEVVDFGETLNDATFESLRFLTTGAANYSKWKEHPHRLRNILKGLSKVPNIQKNLKYLSLSYAELKMSEIQKMMLEFDLDWIEVTKDEMGRLDWDEVQTTPIDYESLGKLYQKFKHEDIEINQDSKLTLHLSDENDIMLVRELLEYEMPQISELVLSNVPDYDLDLKKFLYFSLPRDLSALDINVGGDFIPADFYGSGLFRCASSPQKSFTLRQCKISKELFYDIMRATKNCEMVQFINCDIRTDQEFEFEGELEETSLKSLNFYGCGAPEYSNWKKYPHRLKSILFALGKEKQVQDKLQQIQIGPEDFEEKEMSTIMNECGLQNVKLVIQSEQEK